MELTKGRGCSTIIRPRKVDFVFPITKPGTKLTDQPNYFRGPGGRRKYGVRAQRAR